MSKLPYMPFYGDDFIRKTPRLTPEERWHYLHLLWLMWDSPGGVLADIDCDNARALGISLRKWKSVKLRLCGYLDFYGPVTERQFTQKRLQEVLNKSLEITRVNSENGRLGGQRKSENIKEIQRILSSERYSERYSEMSSEILANTLANTLAKRLALQRSKNITTSLHLAAREEGQLSETAEPTPDGACATDGAAPPAMQEMNGHSYLLQTDYMRRAELKAP